MSKQLSARIAEENEETLNKLTEKYGSKSNAINYLLKNCNTTNKESVIQSEDVIQKNDSCNTHDLDDYGLYFFNDLCEKLFKRSGKNPYRMIQIACNYYYKGLYKGDMERMLISAYDDYKGSKIKKDSLADIIS